jgi:hypothetical protein
MTSGGSLPKIFAIVSTLNFPSRSWRCTLSSFNNSMMSPFQRKIKNSIFATHRQLWRVFSTQFSCEGLAVVAPLEILDPSCLSQRMLGGVIILVNEVWILSADSNDLDLGEHLSVARPESLGTQLLSDIRGCLPGVVVWRETLWRCLRTIMKTFLSGVRPRSPSPSEIKSMLLLEQLQVVVSISHSSH